MHARARFLPLHLVVAGALHAQVPTKIPVVTGQPIAAPRPGVTMAAVAPLGAAPARVTTLVGSPTLVTVQWQLAPGATGYNVFRADRGMLTRQPLPANATSYIDRTPIDYRVDYRYSVAAVYADARGQASAEVIARVPRPSNPARMTAAGDHIEIALDWTPVPTADFYLVSGPGVVPSPNTNAAIVRAPITHYVVTNQPPGTTQRWNVLAVWEGADKAWVVDGNSAAVAALDILYRAPRITRVDRSTSAGVAWIQLVWDGSDGAPAHRLYRAPAGTTAYIDVTSMPGTFMSSTFVTHDNKRTYPDEPEAGKSYEFRLCGVFPPKDMLACTPPQHADFPAAIPFSAAVSASGQNRVTVTWDLPAGYSITKVNIMRGVNATGEMRWLVQGLPDTRAGYVDNIQNSLKTFRYRVHATLNNGMLVTSPTMTVTLP